MGHYGASGTETDRGGNGTMAKATCEIDGCDKPRSGRGWCSMHYQRWVRHGDPLISLYPRPPRTCSIEGCGGALEGRGWCSMHYQRWERWGDPLVTRHRPKAETVPNLGCTCSVQDCDKSAKAGGMCSMHYGRWLRHGGTDKPERKKQSAPCSIEGCDDPSEARGWCDKHYQRWRVHGDPMTFLLTEIITSCSQSGCDRRVAKAGVCWKHYRNLKAKFMAEQEGKCAICGVREDDLPDKTLRLDHDHATGLPRALLCHHCNCGLGYFRDNPALLRIAACYVEEMKPGQLPLFAA